MKATVPVIVLVFAALQFVFVQADQSDAQDSDVRLYEVKTLQDDWGFTLINCGTSDINLNGYSLTVDLGEKEPGGVLKFTQHLMLGQGAKITVVKEKNEWSKFHIRNEDWLHKWGENGIVADDKFSFNETGDALTLKHGDVELDVFAFGEVGGPVLHEWTGRLFPQMKEEDVSFAIRVDGREHECNANAWYFYGTTHVTFDPNLKYTAEEVTPFVFPDSGGIPVYRALEKAKESIVISMYQLNSANMLGLLYECLERGVSITMLLEYKTSEGGLEVGKLQYLVEHGADVWLLFPHYRYDSFHTKYCIIDGETVVVTSENWTYSSFNGRQTDNPEKATGARGWGAIIKCRDYAEYLKGMFENDITDPDWRYGDVWDFESIYPGAESTAVRYASPTDEYPTTTFKNVQITPFMTPDSSWDAISYYMDGAKTRIYAQQQVIYDGYMWGGDSPLSWMMSQADYGKIDVKLLYCMKEEDIEDTLWFIDDLNDNTRVKTGYMYKPYLHNKGMIVDDITILTSVNWTPHGLCTNREMGVIFLSKEVTDFYEKVFSRDYSRNYRVGGLTVSIDGLSQSMEKVDLYEITAVIAQEGTYTYEWTLDGKPLEWDTEYAKFTADIGTHTISLTVKDAFIGNATCTVTFEITGFKVGTSALHALIIIGAVMLVAGALIYLLAVRKNKVPL